MTKKIAYQNRPFNRLMGQKWDRLFYEKNWVFKLYKIVYKSYTILYNLYTIQDNL